MGGGFRLIFITSQHTLHYFRSKCTESSPHNLLIPCLDTGFRRYGWWVSSPTPSTLLYRSKIPYHCNGTGMGRQWRSYISTAVVSISWFLMKSLKVRNSTLRPNLLDWLCGTRKNTSRENLLELLLTLWLSVLFFIAFIQWIQLKKPFLSRVD